LLDAVLKKTGGNKMANEMMRIFFPLKINTYPQHEYGECGVDDPPEEITSAEAVAYEDAVINHSFYGSVPSS
jgi:hypothetical protein